MTIQEFNQLPEQEAFNLVFKCCGSTEWAKQVVAKRPFDTLQNLKKYSDTVWLFSSPPDWLEAFHHHPKIGDIESLKKKFASTSEWASGEQAGVSQAATAVIEGLAKGNLDYERRFGFIFIVCATGKSAEEMLSMLLTRLKNRKEDELQIAMNEQNKITHIRLDKLFS